MRASTPCADPAVAAAFDACPLKARQRLLTVRGLILRMAARNAAIGPLTETQKWGEPAYLTEATRSGTTLRIAWKAKTPDHYALYVNCRTSLIDTYRTLFADLRFEGHRAVVFDVGRPVPRDIVSQCAELALTYHKRGHA